MIPSVVISCSFTLIGESKSATFFPTPTQQRQRTTCQDFQNVQFKSYSNLNQQKITSSGVIKGGKVVMLGKIRIKFPESAFRLLCA